MGPKRGGRALGLLVALGAWAVLTASCTRNRPLLGGDASAAPLPCSCSDGLVCDVAKAACVPCGGRGQFCCPRGCNVDLACDRTLDATFGLCTDVCGLEDTQCCSQGECTVGTTCSTGDQTGTCKACGLPGLKCCRADCWIGVCARTDAPRFCVPCGEQGQPCCEGGGSEHEGCSDGSVCFKAPGDLLGVCTDG